MKLYLIGAIPCLYQVPVLIAVPKLKLNLASNTQYKFEKFPAGVKMARDAKGKFDTLNLAFSTALRIDAKLFLEISRFFFIYRKVVMNICEIVCVCFFSSSFFYPSSFFIVMSICVWKI